MNKITILLLVVSSILSCGTLKEEVWIYPNQQAQLEFSMELGKNMKGPFSETMCSSLFHINIKDDSLRPFFQGNFSIMGMPINNQDILVDTMIYFKDLSEFHPDSITMQISQWDTLQRLSAQQQEQLAHKIYKLMAKSGIHVYNNTPDHFIGVSIKTDKIDIQDLYDIGNGIKQIAADSSNKLGRKDAFLFNAEKGKFRHGDISLWKDILQFTTPGNPEGEMNFLEKLMQNLKTKECLSVVHLPGKVKSVTHPLAKITEDGKTVTILLSTQDIEGGVTFENTIKYK